MALATALSRTNGVTTVTCAYQCGLVTGQRVSVFDSADSTFHGYFTATSASGITGTSFTYDQRFVISSISRTATAAGITTINVTIPSGFDSCQWVVGQQITVTGVTGGVASFNQTYTIASVTDLDTITAVNPAGVTDAATGTVSGSSYAFPANATTTEAQVWPVLKLAPTSTISDTGFSPYGGAATELAAVTDDSDTTYLRATTTSGFRSITFGLSNVGAGAAGIQSNQDAGSTHTRFRATSTASSDMAMQFETPTIAYQNNWISDALSLTGAPGTPNDGEPFPFATAYLDEPMTASVLNDSTLVLYEYATTTAALSKVYEAWVDVYLWAKPYLNAAPTVGVSSTTRPTVSWVPQQADARPQAFYQVSIFTAAKTDPSVSADRVWTSGTVSGTATSAVCGVDLVPGITYYVYVRTATRYDTSSPTYWSPWGSGTATSFATFSITQQLPSPPVLTCSWDSARQATAITATGFGNLLPLNDASMESTAGTWVNNTNATVVRSTAAAYTGTASLRLTSGVAGDMSARTANGTSGVPVTPGVTYKAFGMSLSAVSARSVRMEIYWYNSAGTYISNVLGSAVTNSTSAWTPMVVSGTAPATAAYAAVVYAVLATGAGSEQHYLDMVSLTPNSSGTTKNTNLVLNPSGETGITGVTSAQGVVARSGDFAYAGSRSLTVSTTNAGDTNVFAYAATTGYATPTTAAHTVSAWFYVPTGSALAGRTVTIAPEGGTGANYTSGASSPATLVAGKWVRASRVITWSSTAGLPSLVARLNTVTVGETIYTDGWMLTLGSSPVDYFDGDSGNASWSGTAHAATSVQGQPYDTGGITSRYLTVQRSTDNGATWTTIRNLETVIFTQSTQVVSNYDYEAPRGITVLYRAFVSGTDESGSTASSQALNPAPAAVTTTNDGGWWLKDPLYPALNISVKVQADSVTQRLEEATGVFRVYGRSTAIVTAGAFTGEDGSLEVFATDSEWAALETLLRAQRVFLLQDPNNDQKYVRITDRSYRKEWLGGDQTYRVDLSYVEVDAPTSLPVIPSGVIA